ncbi:LVIVD repeat-containing protein [Natronorubrum daqingense]|uniref:Uncharacterized conserved protein n=1 Tax=Natronorubrum daqingense TaxID=588898 RepID=A0A1N7CMK0_9EURY|nr:beta-propeller domain-containing protein [Natronorubrum daqingense]APX98211.1 hypothetical protein BB347_10265 [Natronorubrum daqingense]SIR64868.1 Uncharacterized conserved protein [Natronorubrum daqingense]
MQRRSFLRAGAGAGGSLLLSEALVSSSPAATAVAAESTPSGYEPLGRVEVDGATEAVVGDDGDTVYVAAADGFATVDISDPSDPEVLAEEFMLEVDGTPFREILDVKVDGDRLAVVGPANRTDEDVFHGFELYDVSDPAEPTVVADYETGFHIHNCFLEDDLLYVVANGEDDNPLVIYDVSDDEVDEIGSWSLLEREPDWEDVYWLARYNHDVYVHDDIAYLAHWNAGTYLVDVSDPSEPTYRSHVSDATLEESLELSDQDAQLGLPGNDHYSAVDDTGDLLAVGREAWETGGDDPDGPGGIDLYDVSDPDEPESLASIDAPAAGDATYDGGEWTTAHNFELRDDRLYSSWYQGGVRIHDVSDPAEPEELAHWRDTDTAGFWTARVADPGETFVASSTQLIPGADTEGALYTFSIDIDAGTAESLFEAIPGGGVTAGAAGITGGVVALEWLRRRNWRNNGESAGEPAGEGE